MDTEEHACSSSLIGNKKQKWYRSKLVKSKRNKRKRRSIRARKFVQEHECRSSMSNSGLFECVEPMVMASGCLEENIFKPNYFSPIRPMNDCKWFWENYRRMSEWKTNFQLNFCRPHYRPGINTVNLNMHEENELETRQSTSNSSLHSQMCCSGIKENTNWSRTSTSRSHLPLWIDTQDSQERPLYFEHSRSNYTPASMSSMFVCNSAVEDKPIKHQQARTKKLSKMGVNQNLSNRVRGESKSASPVSSVANASTEQHMREDSFEFHVDEEMLAFLEQSMKHKMEMENRRKKEEPYSECTTQIQFELDITKCPQHITKQRHAEMKLLYGNASPKIVAMETALHLTFERRLSKKQSTLWPILPLKP